MLGLLAGHLALNAAGSGKAVLDKTAKSPSTVTALNSDARDQAQIAAEAAAKLAAEQPDRLAIERKAKQAAAIAAGHDATIVCNLSDRDLAKLVAGLPPAPKPESQPEEMHSAAITPALPLNASDPQKTLAENEAVKAALEAELRNRAAEPAAVEETAPVEEEDAGRWQAGQDALSRMNSDENVSAADKELGYAYLALHPEEAGGRGGDGALDNVGGPDGGNYFFVDNAGADTATYDWIELRGDVSATYINSWTSHDDGYSYVGASSPGARHPIGFSFPFYGTNQDSFRCATNGFIQFTSTITSLTNTSLPSATITGPAILPYWDDLHLDRNGQTTNQVMYRNFGTYTVIEYDSIGVYNSTCVSTPPNVLKFEVILFNDGKIKIQYNTVAVCDVQDSSMTVGIQSNGTAGSPALQYGFGSGGQTLVGNLPASGRAVWFYQHFYDHDFTATSITSPSGYYLPSTLVSVTARFSNPGLTTESAPVKYSFDGGATVTEATASLAHFGFEDHTFATQITTPAAAGVYRLTVWSDLATDEARGNDTLKTTIQVGGDDCATAITLNGSGPDSAQFSNCTGMTDNTPGQPCGASGKDMVFSVSVPVGYQLVVWESANNTITGRHSLRWGGACPGSNFIDCSTTESRKMRFVNNTGSVQTAWVTIGNTTAPGTCGNVGVGWQLTACASVATPFVDGFEGVTAPLLPNCWSIENAGASTALWENYTTTPRTGTNCASVVGTASPGNNDWLFSPGIQMTADVGYVVEYWRRATSATVAESLEVKAGLTNTSAGMTLVVAAPDTFKSTAYVQKFLNFTPTATGVYYFGWHSMTVSSSGRTRIDDVSIYPSGACSAPTVTVNSATAQDSVTLTASAVGGSGGAVSYQWFTGTGCQEANRILGARSTTYTAHTSGIYSCRAWIIDSTSCASCDSAYANVIDCSAPAALPIFEGLEATTGTAVPPCWTVGEYDTDGRIWTTSTTNPRTGLRAAYISYSASGVLPSDWLFTPPVSLTTGTNYVMDFWWRQYLTSTSYYDSLQVVLTSAPNNVSTVATIVPAFRANTTTYQNTATVFSPPTTGVYYLAFLYTGSANAGGIRVDDIALYTQGFCLPPDSVRVPAVSAIASVTLTATVYGGMGGPAEYQWYHGTTCSNPDSLISGATLATYTTAVSGVFACKAWRANSTTCSGCDSALATVVPDPCLPGPAPFAGESFDGVTIPALPTCWSYVDGNGDAIYWQTTSTTPNSSPNCVRVYASTAGNNDWLFTAPMTLTQGTTYVVEYFRRADLASQPESLEVKCGTLRMPASMTLTVFPADTFQTTTYVRKSTTFTAPTTGSYYFGLHSMTRGSTSYGMRLDDFAIYAQGTCAAPTVTATAASGIGAATLRAAASGGFGGPLQYQWYRGEDCTTGILIPGATDTVYTAILAGAYSCKAWRGNVATCFACDSAYADVQADPCTPATMPFFESFNGVTAPALPNCWRITDADAVAPVWVTSSTYSYSSPNSAFLGWRSPTVNDWLISPPLTLIAGQSYMLDYYYRAASTSWREDLEVKMGTIPNGAYLTTTIVPLDTFRFTTYALKSVMFTSTQTGTYYMGWHGTSANAFGISVDDVRIYARGSCGAPDSVRALAAVGVGSVNLTATVYGGFGGDAHYQWFRGTDCLYANRIEGARTATFSTDTSGVFSCRAWRGDSLTCAACDSALATVTPPPAGEVCATAIALTVPVPGTPTVVSGTTVGTYANCTNICGTATSSGPDMFYSLTLSTCRRITMKLTGGDTHLAIYQGLASCCSDPLLCNGDDASFTPLPAWDVAEQHPGGTASYIAANLNAGTYIIRVAYAGTASGAYALTVYDNGACIAPCDSALHVTVFVSPSNPSQVWLNFQTPDSGSYVIYSSTNKNNDGDPRGGDPMWVTETTVHATAAGNYSWTDPVNVLAYKNYAIVHDCGSPLGRCCYGDPGNPSCADNTEAQCTVLTGSWNQYRSCAAHPCPVVQPAAADSCNGVGELRGALPISVDGSTLGTVDNFSVRDVSTMPACWSGTYYSSSSTAAGPDVCYGWTVPATGTYTISTCGANTTYDTSLLLYNFTCPAAPVNATDLICGADDVCTSYRAEIQAVSLTAGQHVLIVVDTYNSGSGVGGAYNLTITQP
jgi:hypothetical protein